MTKQQILDEVFETYGEWLEYDSENQMLLDIVVNLLRIEKDKTERLQAEVRRARVCC